MVYQPRINGRLIYTTINMRLFSRRSPATSNVDPFCQAASLFSFDIDNVRVAPATAAYAVLLDRIRRGPVFIFFESFLFVFRSHFQKRNARKLSSWCVRGTMLNGRVTVAKISEIVNVTRCEQCASSQRMDWRITPLLFREREQLISPCYKF